MKEALGKVANKKSIIGEETYIEDGENG